MDEYLDTHSPCYYCCHDSSNGGDEKACSILGGCYESEHFKGIKIKRENVED